MTGVKVNLRKVVHVGRRSRGKQGREAHFSCFMVLHCYLLKNTSESRQLSFSTTSAEEKNKSIMRKKNFALFIIPSCFILLDSKLMLIAHLIEYILLISTHYLIKK